MATIDPIYNGESGASVRAKLNELIDTVNSGSTTINVGDAPLFDPLKAGGYEAGSIISYKNESSPDPEFHEFKIYLALTDIPQGVGPEDSADWKNEGASVEIAGGNTANGVVQNIDRLRELTGMRTGHSVTVEEGGHVYVYNEGSEAGVKPFAPGIGSWELKYTKSIVEWQPGIYRSSPTLVLRNNAIYRLTRPVPFESTDFEAEASAAIPVWTKISGGSGHTFEDQSGTVLPARSVAKAGAGIEFEDDAVGEMTVVKVDEDLTDHIDGADEEKHTTNQIIQQLELLKLNLPANSPLHTILQSIDNFLAGTLNTDEIDDAGWAISERRLAILENTINGIQIQGAAQLLDIFAPPGVEASLRDNSGWVNETKTLTGDNSTGQLGQKGAMIWLNDGVYAQCTNAVLEVSGSATYRRNRAVDVLDPVNNTQDAAIANELDPSYTYPDMTPTGNSTDDGWNLTSQVKVITGKPTRWGMWFIGGINGDGYTYHCFLVNGTTSYWKRTGTPSSISRCIYAATHPNLTANLLAHDFGTGPYTQVPGDEVTYADQTFYDAATRSYFIKMINGNWEKIR